MNLDQAHSYLIIVLIRLECFAAPQKVVSAAETSRACLQANSRSKRDLLRRGAAGGACLEKAAPNLAQTAVTSKRVGERSVTFSGRGARWSVREVVFFDKKGRRELSAVRGNLISVFI